MGTVEENRRLTKKVSEEINKGNIEILYETEDTNHILHYSFGQDIKGVGVQGFNELRTIYPDLQTSILDTVAEGDMVASRFTLSGTHTGADYMGIAATGKRFEFEGAMIQRYKDGKVMERWEYLDRLDVLHQRGVIPTLEEIRNLQKQKQTEEENKANIRQQIEECWNKGDFSSVLDLISPSFIYHTPKEDLKGIDGFIAWINLWRTGFPDFHMTIEKMIGDEDTVVVQLTWEGTFTGIFDGNKPTGNKVKMDELWLYRFQNGKDIGPLPYGNMLSLIQQMGINPT